MAFPFHVNMLSGIQPENQWRKLHWKLRKQRKTGKNQVLPEKMMNGHYAEAGGWSACSKVCKQLARD